MSQVIANKVEIREYVQEMFREIRFTLFIEEESTLGNIVTPVIGFEDANLQKLLTILDEHYDMTLSGGAGVYSD